jgi:signal transduction histidine kinase/CheY-like chemotaxis protein
MDTLNIIEDKFHDEIEVERMWVASKQAGYIFFSILPISIILVYVFWESAPHPRLVFWFAMLTSINFFRWASLNFYHTHKEAIPGNVSRIKLLLLIGSLAAGSWWGLGCYWFLDPSEPFNVLLMSIFIMVVATGTILSWFCYLPAVMGLLVTSAMPLSFLLFLDGGKVNLVVSLILVCLTGLSFAHSIKLSRLFNQALQTNLENLALRKESEKKSLLLEKALSEAEHANAAKTRFLAAASHDLRQPIHALGLFFAELSDRVYNTETATLIGQVGDSIGVINSMLNALLDVSKLDAGVVKPTFEAVDLYELFSRLQAEFLPLAFENHNQLKIRPTAARVKSDSAMLERILRNLIGNALRYTLNGRVLVATRKRGKRLIIQVYDTGSGIPDDQLENVFIEFHQLQNPARDRHQGLGLGLAIVKRLAKLLNHEIKVSSRTGHGSCFSIFLPVAFESIPYGPGKLVIKEASNLLVGYQILVVDDDKAILEGMQGLLTRWGCHVVTADSQTEAIDMLTAESQKIHLLIIDYRLPNNVSGIDIARSIQNLLPYPIAVLIITGDTGPERLREADASGYPLLHKPVEPAKLRSTLQYLATKLNTGNAQS